MSTYLSSYHLLVYSFFTDSGTKIKNKYKQINDDESRDVLDSNY